MKIHHIFLPILAAGALLGMAACSSSPSAPAAPVSNPTVTLCAGHVHFAGQIGSFDAPTVYAYWIESPDSTWATLEASEYLNIDSTNGSPALHDTETVIASLSRNGRSWETTSDSKDISMGDTTSLGAYIVGVHVTIDSITVGWVVPETGTTYYLKKLD